MKVFAFLVLAVGTVSAIVHPVQIYGRPDDWIPEEYIVSFDDEQAFTKVLQQKHSFAHPLLHWQIGDFRAVGGRFSQEELEIFQFLDGVQYIHNNLKVTLYGTQVNPPSWGQDRSDQRALPLDNLYRWTDSSNGQNVNVYILDTGIFLAHEDWPAGQALFGVDCSSLFGICRTTSGNGTDPNGHGSHCAGTVASPTYGLAKSARVIDIKVISASGLGSLFSILNGIDYAAADQTVPANAKVISMSLGAASNPSLDDAVNAASASGVIVVAAAGNDNVDACSFSPAGAAGAITIGASDSSDNRAAFSNFGTCVDFFAPGVDIVSIAPASSGTNTYSGTSMACPHAAGAAAAVASRGIVDPEQVRETLVGEATPNVINNPGVGSPNLLLFTNPIV